MHACQVIPHQTGKSTALWSGLCTQTCHAEAGKDQTKLEHYGLKYGCCGIETSCN